MWVLGQHALDRERQIARFTRVVEPTGLVRLVATTPEDQEVRSPASGMSDAQQSADVVRPHGPLQPVQHEETW